MKQAGGSYECREGSGPFIYGCLEEPRSHIHLPVETGAMLRHSVYHDWDVLKRPGLHGLCGVVQILKVNA